MNFGISFATASLMLTKFLTARYILSLILCFVPFVAIPVNIQNKDLQNNIVTVLNSNIPEISINRIVFPDNTNSAYAEVERLLSR